MNQPRIRVERAGATATFWLDRPPLNVIDIALMQEAAAALAALPPPPEVRFVVFRGAGEKCFSAGAEVADHTPERVREMLGSFHRLFRLLWAGDWVTISAVHGHCLGGGMEVATFCDFVIAARGAKFGQPEIKLACFPPIAAIILPARIGLNRALDLILTGRSITAEEAHRIGLVTTLVEDGKLDEGLSALLGGLGPLSGAALALTRRAVLQASGFDFEAALAGAERLYFDRLMKTSDAVEGIRAFLEKRKPTFVGR